MDRRRLEINSPHTDHNHRQGWTRLTYKGRELLETARLAYRKLRTRRSIRHIHGPKDIPYGRDELIVTCLVRNGSLYLDSYINHYFALGVKYIVFLDNGSTDDTVEVASGHVGVTVLGTDLPYGVYENLLKDYLVRRFSTGRWNLFADVDELFDYPFSEVMGLRSLLGYLGSKGYTAVVAQMLDLFADAPISQLEDPQGTDLKSKYIYYDTSKVEKWDYLWSVPSDSTIRMHRGGVRAALFNTQNGLTKAPLVFVGAGIQVFVDWHHTQGAQVADFTCVLLHYPFTSTFYEKVKEAAATSRYGPYTSSEYELYWRRLSQEPALNPRLATSRRYTGTACLLDEGFLVVSPDYLDWVRSHPKTPSS